ncbi:hypothetical protein [Flavobacterium hungaricum]|uniref:Uncharacterized protein n=1 Tax=Flavobacterium hungaricum TaxID=2082725 RepID=A0ABR9TJL3_9FLAO|nr:hypothetical protein [Flavobacterium hungaricum]MBE8725546.1 hypothetical protein [Flavobacterium hungaricum]
MIIALHGGFTLELLYSLVGGFIAAIAFVVYVHYRVSKTEYYREEYVYFSEGRKLLIYFGFLIVILCFAYLLFWIFTFIFAGLIFK